MSTLIQNVVRVPTCHKIATHVHAHVDEHVGISLFKRYSSPDAVIEFLRGEPEGRLTRDPSVALIGIGGGVYDEHKEEGRLPAECSSTLIAKDLGIANNPELQLLLSEVLRADTEAGQSHMEWGELVKTLHTYSDLDDAKVSGFVHEIVNAYVNSALENPARNESPDFRVDWSVASATEADDKPRVNAIVLPAFAPASVIFMAWAVGKIGWRRFKLLDGVETVLVATADEFKEFENRADVIYIGIPGGQFPPEMPVADFLHSFGVSRKKDEKAYHRLRVVAGELKRYETDPEGVKPFEFGPVITLLNRFSNLEPEDIAELACTVFSAYMKRAVEFNELCPQEFKEHGKLDTVGNLKVAFVTSDLRAMNSYCRARLGADVVVVRGERGNVALFTGHNQTKLAWYIADEIIVAEVERKYGEDADASEATHAFGQIVFDGRGKNLPAPADHWYFFMEAGQILNASESHPDIRPTKLNNRSIRQAVIRGINEYSTP